MRFFLILLMCSAASAEDRLRLYPSEIRLEGKRDFQTVVLQQQTAEGLTLDLQEVDLTITDTSIARVEGRKIIPVGDGQTTLQVNAAGRMLSAKVSVQAASDDPPISFRLDVMPVLSKAGCNSGRCHGAARGKDGFRLSLYGFDPKGDHFRLTRQLVGRRINLARPEASLLLTKAIGEAPHTGGQRFSDESPHYATLHRWLSEGAGDDQAEVASPTEIEILPPNAVLAGSGTTQQLVVRATYSDGTTRDVTHLATFLSNNDSCAEVAQDGLVTAGTGGESFVMARFATFTEGIPVITLSSEHQSTPWQAQEYHEFDRLVHQKLRKLRIAPSEVCSDERFLRRVFIDLAGILPTRQEYERFLADPSPQKRAKLVDELLSREEFVDLWTMKFGELLKIRTANQVSYKALFGFHNWLRQRIAGEVPLNEIIGEVISAEGGTFDSPPTNYFQMEPNPPQLAENVAQSFLGMRIQCAQCHNHPFDRWTMDDYYGFTAFFSQIGFKQSRDPREYIVHSKGEGEVYHIVDNRVVAPKFLGGATPDIDGKSRREVLADWVSSDDNPYLAKHLANMIWAHHFGRGIVDPVDDVRISNPPSNPELLEELAARLKQSKYNLKSLVREICLSRTYQLCTQANETNQDDFHNFSRAHVRRIRAEVLLDSISQITATQDRFARLPEGARSVQIADGAVSNYFLSTFGRAPRQTVCSCEVDVEPTLSQAFHLLNGETTNEKIAQGRLVTKLLREGKTPAEVIEHLSILCFSRRPTAEEQRELQALVSQSKDQVQALHDIFWAMLNSKEFIFNH